MFSCCRRARIRQKVASVFSSQRRNVREAADNVALGAREAHNRKSDVPQEENGGRFETVWRRGHFSGEFNHTQCHRYYFESVAQPQIVTQIKKKKPKKKKLNLRLSFSPAVLTEHLHNRTQHFWNLKQQKVRIVEDLLAKLSRLATTIPVPPIGDFVKVVTDANAEFNQHMTSGPLFTKSHSKKKKKKTKKKKPKNNALAM